MRAALLTDVGRIELRDVPRAEPRAHEVTVRVHACGLCGTDLHIFAGHGNYNRDERGRVIPLAAHPQILGHEIVGVVETTGIAVHDLQPGDRVILDQGRNCVSEGRTPICEYCASGDSHQCERYAEHGITGLPGGFAEFVTIPAVNAVCIEASLDVAAAALTEPLACIVHATDLLMRVPARYTLHGVNGRRVRCAIVAGAGPSGLLFVQYLRSVMGFDGHLLVSEPNAARRALAERFGAEAVDPSSNDIGDVVQERTDGRRADLLIEASGSGAVFVAIPGIIRKQGTVVLYGHGHVGTELTAMNAVQFLEPTLISSTGASGGFEDDGRPTTYVRALRLIENAAIDVASLITHRYESLESVPGAFAGDHRDPGYVKGVIIM